VRPDHAPHPGCLAQLGSSILHIATRLSVPPLISRAALRVAGPRLQRLSSVRPGHRNGHVTCCAQRPAAWCRRTAAHGSCSQGGSVRSRGSLPEWPLTDRFPGPFRRRSTRHELPALSLVVAHRTGWPNGARLPALSVPGLRTAVQRAHGHGAEPCSVPNRHCLSGGVLAPRQRVAQRRKRQRSPRSPSVNYATRTELGHPRSSIRLRTEAATATSVARASSLWKRSPSPMTCFQRANWPSTRALSL
jgi:hypothetical protein